MLFRSRILGDIPWYADTLVIDNFNSDLTGRWKQPSFSGTTEGLLNGETAANSRYVNHNTNSSNSMRIYYKFDTEADYGLARIYLDVSSPQAQRKFTDASILQAWVFGDGSGNLLRFALDDPSGGASNHEVSPWYPLDFTGWKLIKWDLRDGETGVWDGISDGTFNGPLNFDSFQIEYVDSLGNNEGTIYIDDMMVLTPGGVGVGETDVPQAFALEQNYPNPFNPATTISYQLTSAGRIDLSVFDVNGRHVRTLVSERKNAGTHSIDFDASDLPSGVYIARLQHAAGTLSRKMLLVK